MSAGPIDLSSVCGIGPEAMITDRLPFSSIIAVGPAFSRTCIERRRSRPSPHQRAAAAGLIPLLLAIKWRKYSHFSCDAGFVPYFKPYYDRPEAGMGLP